MGLQDYAFEAVIMRYPKQFTEAAVQLSKERLHQWDSSKAEFSPNKSSGIKGDGSIKKTGRKYSDDQIAVILKLCIDVALERSTKRSAEKQVEKKVPSYPFKNFDGELRRVALYLTGHARYGFRFPANWAKVFIDITNGDSKVIAAFREQQKLYKEHTGSNSKTLNKILSNYPQVLHDASGSISLEPGFLSNIVREVNARSIRYELGSLQKIRKELLGLKRLPMQEIFARVKESDDWVCHYGGRGELQFNIGLESVNGHDRIRFGVAFSLETSQSLPDIAPLIPKIALFNDYIQSNSDSFADMRMWHYQGVRSSESTPSTIPPELVTKGVFIFLGICQPIEKLDYESAVIAMNRLLPLYIYIEAEDKEDSTISSPRNSWARNFKPGFTPKLSSTNASFAERELDINLRHNVIQEALYEKLSLEHGHDNVVSLLSR